MLYSSWFIIAPRPPAQGDAAHMNRALPHQLPRKCPTGQSDGGTFSWCLFCIKLAEGKELRRTSWSLAIESVGWCPKQTEIQVSKPWHCRGVGGETVETPVSPWSPGRAARLSWSPESHRQLRFLIHTPACRQCQVSPSGAVADIKFTEIM